MSYGQYKGKLVMNTLFNLEGALGASKRIDGGLAQLGERLPCKQEVTGSIPVLSTKRSHMGQ